MGSGKDTGENGHTGNIVFATDILSTQIYLYSNFYGYRASFYLVNVPTVLLLV